MPDREGVQAVKGGPSEAAVEHAKRTLSGRVLTGWQELELSIALAHDPALGLDRSVRLGDVVAALGSYDAAITPGWAAEVIAREFGAT